VYSYLSDITAVGTRTKRMGWMDAVWYMGGPVGTVMGVWLYRAYGYLAVFTVSASLWIICLIYTIAVVQESVVQISEAMPKSKPFQFVLDLSRVASKCYPHRGRLHLFWLIAIKLGVFLVQGHQVKSFKFTSLKILF
jgi:MFS family permease